MAKFLQVSLLVLAGVLAVSAQCPAIIPRNGWSTRESRFVSVLPIRPTPLVVAHPTGTDTCFTQAECSALIREIQTFQMDANGWPEISYHFLIGGDNRIYQGRGWGRLGQNVGQFSNQAINVGFLGRFVDETPSAEALEAFESLVGCGVSEGALTANVAVSFYLNTLKVLKVSLYSFYYRSLPNAK